MSSSSFSTGSRTEWKLRSILFFKCFFSPQIALQAKGSLGQFEGKSMSITLKTPLCFPEPEVGQHIAVLLQEWSGTRHRKRVWILQKRLSSEQKTPQPSLNYESRRLQGLYRTSGYLCREVAGAILAQWEISGKKIITCLKGSSKYILTWMLTFCSNFFMAVTFTFIASTIT